MEVGERVEASSRIHTFQGATINAFVGTTKQKIGEILELAAIGALFDDTRDGRLTHISDTAHAKADLTFVIDGELIFRLVDIWPQHLNLHTFALFHHKGHLFDVAQFVVEHRRHELGRIVCLEICRLV